MTGKSPKWPVFRKTRDDLAALARGKQSRSPFNKSSIPSSLTASDWLLPRNVSFPDPSSPAGPPQKKKLKKKIPQKAAPPWQILDTSQAFYVVDQKEHSIKDIEKSQPSVHTSKPGPRFRRGFSAQPVRRLGNPLKEDSVSQEKLEEMMKHHNENCITKDLISEMK